MESFLDSFGITSFFIALVGGIFIGIPTGPARFFVVDTSLNDGRTAALRVYAGLFCAILIYAGMALLADDLISQNKKIEAVSYFVASLLLVFWGGLIIVKSRKKSTSSIQFSFGSWFVKGFVTGLSNPIIPFIYLAFIQLLKGYSDKPSLLVKVFFILVFELVSFLTTSFIAFLLMKKRKGVLGIWRIIKILMGGVLIVLGAYNAYQQLDLSKGLKIKQHKNLLEHHTRAPEK